MARAGSGRAARRERPLRAGFIRVLAWLAGAVLALSAAGGHAQPAVEVYAFVADGCPHCEKALAFLQREAAQRAAVGVHALEVTRSTRNADVLAAVARELAIDDSAVPFIVIGERVFVGYLDDHTSGAALGAQIDACASRPAAAMWSACGCARSRPPLPARARRRSGRRRNARCRRRSAFRSSAT